MLQSKDKGWQNGFKKKKKVKQMTKYNKTHLYAAYRGLTSDLKAHIQSESEEMEKHLPVYESKKKAGVTMFISDKTDFKRKTVKRKKNIT